MPKVEFLTRQQKRERTVDEIIDIYRKRKHITKSDLAKKINMPRSTFNVKVSKNQGVGLSNICYTPINKFPQNSLW